MDRGYDHTTMADAPTAPETQSSAPDDARPSLGRCVAIGVAVALALAAIVFFLIAIPFYTLASFEPNGGVDRPIIRTGLFRIALPVGSVVGIAGGTAVGRWLRRGGGWTVDDGGDRYSNR
jgi:hypothetical protein